MLFLPEFDRIVDTTSTFKEKISKSPFPLIFALWLAVGNEISNAQVAPDAQNPPPIIAPVAPANEIKEIEEDPIFAEFLTWAQNYARAAPTQKSALETQGVELATRRRKILQDLIVFQPQRALKLAISPTARGKMPANVVVLLEKFVSERGEYLVMIRDTFGTQGVKSRVQRTIVLDGQVFFVSAYGRRAGVPSKKLLAVHGIAIDRYLAVYAAPVRALEAGETIPEGAKIGNPNKICPISGKDATKGVIGDVGGVFFYFLSAKELEEFATKIERQEDIPDPDATGL